LLKTFLEASSTETILRTYVPCEKRLEGWVQIACIVLRAHCFLTLWYLSVSLLWTKSPVFPPSDNSSQGIKPQLFWLADRQNSPTKHSLASPWSAIVKCPKGSRSYTRPLVCPCLESWPQCYLQLRLALGGPFRAGLARGVILLRINETASLYKVPRES
jgi:hypothetical protein